MEPAGASQGTASIGLMLYSVRAECERDFDATLQAVAGLGYAGVELFDLHGHAPGRVREWLRAAGLTACGRHARLEHVEDGLADLAAEAEALDWRRLVVSWVDPAELEDPHLVARIAAARSAAEPHGLELGFHNHAAELAPLSGGRTFLELLPDDVFLELDLGWAWYAGADPAALLEQAAGRCPLVHVKDFRDRTSPPPYCPVGQGAVGYEEVAPAAIAAGAEWLLVEQDETDGPALDAAAGSIVALRRMLGRAA